MTKQVTNFIELRFPEDISYGSVGGPEYFNNIIESINFTELRAPKSTISRMRYNVTPGINTSKKLEKIIAFFRTCRGRLIGFRYKDWMDYTATTENIAVCDGVCKNFQLSKKYTIDNTKFANGAYIEYIRIINKPVEGTVRVFANSSELDKSAYTLDYTTGIIYFSEPPQKDTIITASFEFDVPVRFDIDYMPITLEGDDLYSCCNIQLVEIMRQ